MMFLVILALTGGALATDPECTGTVAANGQSGRCVYASSCPYTYYISHRCPSYGNSVKCCYNCHLGGCSYPPPPPVTPETTSQATATTTTTPTTTTPTTTIPTTTIPTTTTPATTTDISTTTIPITKTTPEDDPDCADTQAANGQSGQCAHVDSCPFGFYVTNKCPDYGSDIKCCYNCHLGGCSLSAPTTTLTPATTTTTTTPTTTTDKTTTIEPECADTQAANGQSGQCAHVDSCPFGFYVTNKCPDYGSDIKCCYNCHLGGCSLSAPTTTLSTPFLLF
ncbi:integumentary mucin C.1-like [Branchiostoma floridae]|uniref:Integumentary mucin C.1-like n=1 Tax=Branchiostoma floridae TaxID=7739 RepID=A0A9J7LFH2_BRAFL|nr:integumentary mucin C.1-like [Branchiostoma floridae]